jgi:uncharacterized protein
MEDDARVAELVRRLALAPHPEGGRYRELYRSPAITTIAFLLAAGESSRWHRVMSDEIWHFYEGDPLALWTLDASGERLDRIVLGPDQGRMHAVPAGYWQAARPLGRYALVGCDVAPAFEFANFTMLGEAPERMMLLERYPELAHLL